MLDSTLVAMVTNLVGFVRAAQGGGDITGYVLLAIVGGILLVLCIWLVIEAALVLRKPVVEAQPAQIALPD